MINKNVRISAGLILAAFALRLTQVFTLIDFKTGFYKRDYSILGLILIVLVFGLCVAAAIVSRNSLNINKFKPVKALPIISGVTAFAILYELSVERFVLEDSAWQIVLMKACGFIAVLYFVALAFSKVWKIKIPDLLHIIPAVYLIMRIICSFINISSLSLIAENIFFIAALCCTLLFFVSYAAFYCLDVPDKNLNFRTVLASSICYVTAASNLVANIFVEKGYNHIPLYSQFVMMMLALFIAAFAFSGIFKTKE